MEDINSLRTHLKALVSQKDEIESQIKALNEYLDQGGFGMKGSLVDKEGFPISDVSKILSVRDARNKIAVLQTDHLNLMKEIEQKMYELHQANKQQQEKKQTPNETKSPKVEEKVPFAVVNQVAQSSPASNAGLLPQDLIVSFGSVNEKNHDNLKAIGDLVQRNVGNQLQIQVKRNENGKVVLKQLNLTPQKWSGRGLLGCHLLPFKPTVT